ncbi:hypothetical protein HF086_011500 [Spodoptera exigua]|uniref:Uncharacterized protein n=1 Tax=Spodoptera exigua TaxID=7107 RepID=A0A922M4R1_SPOEX|nr:hypothetical protein HF086_011500 [Spodoptera exigua]
MLSPQVFRFATSKSNFCAKQFIVNPELQRETLGERKRTEGKETDEHASRSVARQDGGWAGNTEACPDPVSSVAQQLYRWTATVFNYKSRTTVARSGWTVFQLLALLTPSPRQDEEVPGLLVIRRVTGHRLDVDRQTSE